MQAARPHDLGNGLQAQEGGSGRGVLWGDWFYEGVRGKRPPATSHDRETAHSTDSHRRDPPADS